MIEVWSILLAAGIPSTLTGIVIARFVKKQNDRDTAREEMNVLLIQGIGAAISLGEASATALKNGKTNGETERALEYATGAKHSLANFMTRQGVKSTC